MNILHHLFRMQDHRCHIGPYIGTQDEMRAESIRPLQLSI